MRKIRVALGAAVSLMAFGATAAQASTRALAGRTAEPDVTARNAGAHGTCPGGNPTAAGSRIP